MKLLAPFLKGFKRQLKLWKQTLAIALTWTYVRTLLSEAFWKTDTMPMAFTSSVTAIFWSFLLWSPGDTFSREEYYHLSIITNEDRWALAFLIIGICQISTIFFRMNRHHWFHQTVSAIAAFVWIYVAAAFLLIYPMSSAAAAYVVFAWGSLWVFIRSGSGGGHRDS